MELREEAWSPGPLDSEDQQMASHENPGEVALVVHSTNPTAFLPGQGTILCDSVVCGLLPLALQESHTPSLEPGTGA